MTRLYALLADTSDDSWGHMNGWGGGWMWLWGIAMMALFVMLIIWLVRATTAGPQGQTHQSGDPIERARGILAERFARGELTSEEYRERADQL